MEWLNEAIMTNSDTVKVQNLCKAQEILINKEPHLLNDHLDDVLQFGVDRNAEVKKTVAAFIEEVGYEILIFLLHFFVPLESRHQIKTKIYFNYCMVKVYTER